MLSVKDLVASVRATVRCLDAEAAIAECDQNNGVLIDVREPGEVQSAPTRSNANIPRGVLEMKIGEICKEAGEPVYLHCAAGARAILAAEQLQRIGYTKVTAIAADVSQIQGAQSQ